VEGESAPCRLGMCQNPVKNEKEPQSYWDVSKHLVGGKAARIGLDIGQNAPKKIPGCNSLFVCFK
jgi:hypothetical protein